VIALSLEIAGLKRPLQFDSSVGAFGSSCVQTICRGAWLSTLVSACPSNRPIRSHERHRVGPWSGPVKPGPPLDLRAAMKSKH
jgi:hypothetical protein